MGKHPHMEVPSLKMPIKMQKPKDGTNKKRSAIVDPIKIKILETSAIVTR